MRLQPLIGVLAVTGATCIFAAYSAFAVETSTRSAALPVGTAALAAPASVSATVNCPNAKKGDVLVQWAPSSSAFVSGYTVLRAVNGGAPVTLTSLPATASTYDDTTIASATSYVYDVVATYQNWTSNAAASPSATTAKHC